MLRRTRQRIIQSLWQGYQKNSAQMTIIEQNLRAKGMENTLLDHFAIIDLPGPHTGIPTLHTLFTAIGYIERGKGYLADKQNDFLWMAEKDAIDEEAIQALPQAVIADFRLDQLPEPVHSIIKKYSDQAPSAPIATALQLIERIHTHGDEDAANQLTNLIVTYCTTRDWALPTVEEFATVFAFNRLLAWVLVFGRTPNHFTLSLHHLPFFANIAEFHHYVENELNLPLNAEGGKIKGSPQSGLMQGSTAGTLQSIALANGEVELPTGFVEFVWRFPLHATAKPFYWNDYFSGFIAENADRVIESLTSQ